MDVACDRSHLHGAASEIRWPEEESEALDAVGGG